MSEARQPTGRTLDQEELRSFQQSLRGSLIRPADDGYDEARRIWNAMVDKRPAIIVKCSGAPDIAASIAFARSHNLPLAIRGGGHNVAGNALSDNGLVIDLSNMKAILVDPDRQTARAEPGVLWSEFDRETQAHGLATTGGVVGSTGIAGFTLGGGVGWLHAKYGLTADNLLSAEVVLADGSVVKANSQDNADLFWALRGGGGNFGVVSSFEYQLYPVEQVLAGPVFHPAERAFDVLRFYRDFTADLPDELTVYTGILTDPEGNKLIGVVACYVGSMEEGERLVKPLREFGSPVADNIGPMPYTTLQSMFDPAFPPDYQNYWKSGFLADVSDDALKQFAEFAIAAPSPSTMVMIENYHGAYSRVDPTATAYNHRDGKYDMLILANWVNPEDTEKNVKWAREFYQGMQPYLAGTSFPNLMGQEEIADRAREAYGTNYARLAEIKKRYDPDNLFRLNLNVKPAE